MPWLDINKTYVCMYDETYRVTVSTLVSTTNLQQSAEHRINVIVLITGFVE